MELNGAAAFHNALSHSEDGDFSSYHKKALSQKLLVLDCKEEFSLAS